MNKYQVSVAIPAYNEEGNIGSLIRSLLNVNGEEFSIHEILIFLDGSSDNTYDIVANIALRSPKLKLHFSKVRRGKVFRLNEIYRSFTGDFLVVLDADISVPAPTIPSLIRDLINSPMTVLVAAHQIPLQGHTFISRIIVEAYQIWDDVRLSLPSGDHIQNFYGAASAYRGSFASSLQIPGAITDERGYIYLQAKKYGSFHYLFQSPIYYWPVTTFHDFRMLADRSFNKNQQVLIKYFGTEAAAAYHIDNSIKAKSIIAHVFRHPLLALPALALNAISRIMPAHDPKYSLGMWEISTSTKQKIEDHL